MEQTCSGRLRRRGELGQRVRACAETADLWLRLRARERGRGDWKISGLFPRRAWTRTLTGCCLGILTSLAAALPAADLPPHPPEPQTREEAPRAVITFRDGCLSVSTHGAPWEEVLQELERYTGVQIRVKGPLAGTLTQAFEALPLERALRRLFREVNTVFFYAPGLPPDTSVGRLAQVWLWPREDQTVAEWHPSPRGNAPRPIQEKRPSEGEIEEGGIRAEAVAPVEESAAATELEAHHQALHAMAQQEALTEVCQRAPELRAHALRRLYDAGLVEERTAVSDLCEGFQSDSPGDND
jgi:hypothetical protein